MSDEVCPICNTAGCPSWQRRSPVDNGPLLDRAELMMHAQSAQSETPRDDALLLLRRIREPSAAMLAAFADQDGAAETWRGMIDRAITEGAAEPMIDLPLMTRVLSPDDVKDLQRELIPKLLQLGINQMISEGASPRDCLVLLQYFAASVIMTMSPRDAHVLTLDQFHRNTRALILQTLSEAGYTSDLDIAAREQPGRI